MSPVAVGSEIADKSGDLLVVQPDEQITTADKIVIEPIDITLYKFEESTPQPMSYYTDLLEIQNTSNESAIINIRIENIYGQENLGSIIIWFFENQTNTPDKDTPIGSAKITNTTRAVLNS